MKKNMLFNSHIHTCQDQCLDVEHNPTVQRQILVATFISHTTINGTYMTSDTGTLLCEQLHDQVAYAEVSNMSH